MLQFTVYLLVYHFTLLQTDSKNSDIFGRNTIFMVSYANLSG